MPQHTSIGVLNAGVERQALAETASGAGSAAVTAVIQTDTVLATLFVGSTAGDLTVTLYAVTDDDNTRKVPLFSFPVVSAPTVNLILKRAAISTSKILIEAVYSDSVSYEVQVRAIQAGLSDTKILGAATLSMSQQDISSGTPQVVIPSDLQDRAGLLIKNWSNSGIVFLGASPTEASVAAGYPLGPKDAVAMDVQAGVTVYGVADAGTVDLRIAQSGG